MQELSTQQFSNLIAEIHRGKPKGAFSSECLRSLAGMFSSNRAALVRVSISGDRDRIFASIGFDKAQLQRRISEVRLSRDELFDRRRFPDGEAFTARDARIAESAWGRGLQSRFANYRKSKNTLIGIVSNGPFHQTLVWFSRGEGQGDFSQCDIDALEMILPHLLQATETSDQITDLHVHRDAAAQILDRTPMGLFFLGAEGAMLYKNQTARQFLGTRDGFVIRDGRLSLRFEEQRKQFEGFLEEFRNNEDPEQMKRQRMSVKRASGDTPYLMVFVPLCIQPVSGRLHGRKVVLLQVHNPAAIDERVFEDLESFYGLTTAEARVCDRLWRSRRLSGVADELGVSLNTAKTHLIRSFRKIGVNSQAELLQRLALHPKRDW